MSSPGCIYSHDDATRSVASDHCMMPQAQRKLPRRRPSGRGIRPCRHRTGLFRPRQAGHRHFASAVAAHVFAARPSPTSEQFTDRARRVVAAASQAAAVAGQDTLTTVRLLPGLFSEPDGLACRALATTHWPRPALPRRLRAPTSPRCCVASARAAKGPAHAQVGNLEQHRASHQHVRPAETIVHRCMLSDSAMALQ